MNKNVRANFMKRYDKFKDNNLPTPFWDEERQTLEYVYYNTNLNPILEELSKDCEGDIRLNIDTDISNALGTIASTGIYYPYTCKHFRLARIDEKDYSEKIELGRTHSHSFNEVIEDLYSFPESFKIEDSDKKYFSDQELKYLNDVQKYLLFIGLKDKESSFQSDNRYKNEKQKLYEGVSIRRGEDIETFLRGERDYIVHNWYEEYTPNPDAYKNHSQRALLTDENGDFKIYIEYTSEEVKLYKDIKDVVTKDNLQDDDKVILAYFKILEVF